MNRPLIVGAVGAAVILAAIAAAFFIDRAPDDPLPASERARDVPAVACGVAAASVGGGCGGVVAGLPERPV